MFEFWIELLRRAGAEMLAAKGTTFLGGVVVPIAFFVLQFIIKIIRTKKVTLNRDDLITDGCAAGITWLVLVTYFVFFTVPREIREEAEHYNPSIRVSSLPVDKAWRRWYDQRKKHYVEEVQALAQGTITPERQQLIRSRIALSGMSCVTNFWLLGALQSDALDKLESSIKAGGWRAGATTISGMVIGYNPPADAKIYVTGSGELDNCGRFLANAIGVKYFGPNSGMVLADNTVVVRRLLP